MKTAIKITLALVLALMLSLCMLSCNNGQTPAEQPDSPSTDTTNDGPNEVTKTGVWENAKYFTDTELGEGAKTVIVTVKAEGQSVTFTIKTDRNTVGDALIDNALVEGDESTYGLYIKKVNGILADYNIDGSYWAFYINGKYAISGVDTTEITEGAVYSLEYTK